VKTIEQVYKFSLVFLFFLLTTHLKAAERPILFEGYLVYTNTYLPSHETKRLTFSFQRSGCDWLLKSGVEPRTLGYTETGFDGTNVYHFTYWNSDSIEKARTAKKTYFVTGQVAPTTIPDFDAAWSRHVWFALMLYSCPAMTTLSPCDLVTGGKVITNCNRVLFPSFETAGSYITKAVVWSQGTDVLDNGQVVPLGSPFEKGFMNLTFESWLADWPQGTRVPTNFEYHVYGAIGNSPTPLWSLFGVVANIEIGGAFSPYPDIVDTTYVTDIRATNFGDRQIVNYLTTNKWLQPGDPGFIKLTDIKRDQRLKERHQLSVRWIIIGFSVAGLFLIFLVARRRDQSPTS